MFHNSNNNLCSGFFRIAIGITMLSISAAEASISALQTEACEQARPIPIGQTIEDALDRPVSEKIFFLDVPTAGLLSIEVTGKEWMDESPDLKILSARCRPVAIDRRTVAIERSPNRQVLALSEPAIFYLRLTATERIASSRFQLTTHLLPATIMRSEVMHSEPGLPLWSGATATVVEKKTFHLTSIRKNEPEEVDPDPNKSQVLKPLFTWLTARDPWAKNEPEEVDPDPNKSLNRPKVETHLVLFPADPRVGSLKNEPEEVDPDPNKATPGSRRTREGLLIVDSRAGAPASRAWIRLSVASDRSPSTPDGSLLEWLAAVHEAEVARARLLTPGAGDPGLLIEEYEADLLPPQ